MAYVSQEMKAKLAPAVKDVLKKYNLKGSLAVNNHSTLALTITGGKLNFFEDYAGRDEADRGYIQVNHYWIQNNFNGEAAACLTELVDAMKGPDFFDNSDPQADYFNVSHYLNIQIGKWNRPYALVK